MPQDTFWGTRQNINRKRGLKMVRITARNQSGMVVEIDDGKHQWLGDEPAETNGTDQGPTPYELLLSSLAACTCITMRMYCNHKGIPLESIKAEYTHLKVAANEVSDTESTEKVDKIVGKVEITGDFDDAQRKRLTNIASRCPVHKTLTSGAFLIDEVQFSSD
jgi:putative redox protein